jgi:hypothetical protein
VNYRREPASVTTLLMLALAHLYDDLGAALTDVLRDTDVRKADYDSVYDSVIECLDETADRRNETIKERFLQFAARYFPGVNESVSDLRTVVWISAHEAVAAETIRANPENREEAIRRLAHAYWEAGGEVAVENWFRAAAFVDSVVE